MAKKRLPPDIRDFFVRKGREGGLIGGKARAEKLTDEGRKESAGNAVKACWAKHKKKKSTTLLERMALFLYSLGGFSLG